MTKLLLHCNTEMAHTPVVVILAISLVLVLYRTSDVPGTWYSTGTTVLLAVGTTLQ
jgi:hypothetical protein